MDEDPHLKEVFGNLDKWIDEKEKYCEKIEALLVDIKKEYKTMVDKLKKIPVVEKEIENINNKNEKSKKRLEFITLKDDITTHELALSKSIDKINDIINCKGDSKNLSLGLKFKSKNLLFGPDHRQPTPKNTPKASPKNECNGPQCPQQGGARATRKKHRR